ncbi:TetR/AcrR family transcriptional regulator [Williamsia phyllosphaerae]|uniref:TetR family transcriptional regulator n=1 Tax=Williamsia phyllosphaerae TaxID=885042 RepID=A0ABQ1V3Y9_9NOCA|nr:TetR family transcriptional regulator [Williamsia phyllosphaerae]GGF34606.1 TetR family transcriptional regulator [Williamsia phyllosphaerae]
MPTSAASDQGDTFIREKRRQQLIDATIAVIAEDGVARATFVAIAARAGVSRGVINYHFADRRALLDAVVAHIYSLGRDMVEQPVEASTTAAEAISAMIVGSIGFYDAHIREMTALSSIFRSGDADASTRDARAEHTTELAKLTAVFLRGQESGEFRAFDTEIMATALRATLDATIGRIAAGSDAGILAREIDDLFGAATRSEQQ